MFLSNDIVINSQIIIGFICLFLWQAFFILNIFVKRLSNCRKSDEMLCLCVRLENSNLQRFKFIKKTRSISNYLLLNKFDRIF